MRWLLRAWVRPDWWCGEGGAGDDAPARRRVACLVLGGALLLGSLCPGVSRSQRLGREFFEPTPPYITIQSTPSGARVQLIGAARVGGPTPLAVPGSLRGRYRLELAEPGYQIQRATLTLLGPGRSAVLSGPHAGAGAGDVVATVLVPGAGHWRDTDLGRGTAWFTAAVAAVTGAGVSHYLASGYADDVQAAEARFLAAMNPAERAAAGTDWARAVAGRDGAEAARGDYVALAAGAWGLSIIDRYLLAPRMGRVEVREGEIALALQRARPFENLLRSIIPGMGQYHSGRNRTAGRFVAGSLFLGYGALVLEHRYVQSVGEIRALERLYDDPLADPELLRELRPVFESRIDQAETHRTQRNIVMGMALGLWAWNLVDAYIGTPAPRRFDAPSTSFDAGYGGSADRALSFELRF